MIKFAASFKMEVYRNTDNLPEFIRATVTIGTFDGVHLGHKKVLGLLKEEARKAKGETVILTFYPHPRNIVGSTPHDISMINSIEERIELIRKEGIDHLVIVPFTEEFSRLSPRQYVEDFLIKKFHPHTLVIGYDHRFGFNREGGYDLLQEYASRGCFSLMEIPAYMMKDNTVSSTSIRNFLYNGNCEQAAELLGYPFFITGTVIHGDKIGRKIGYPTANIRVAAEDKLIPKDGIYAVTAELPETDPGIRFKGMLSIGFRPTVNGKFRVIEVHIFGLDKEIYDNPIRIYFHKYLRPELKFENLESLTRQMDLDKETSLEVLSHL